MRGRAVCARGTTRVGDDRENPIRSVQSQLWWTDGTHGVSLQALNLHCLRPPSLRDRLQATDSFVWPRWAPHRRSG